MRAFSIVLIVSAALFARTALSQVPSLPLDEVRGKYQVPSSQYVDLDGVNVHFLDEGQGPPVVFLHASYTNLRSWDPLATRLKQKFRVIRFDFANAGLTGPDPKELNSIERNIDLLERLLAHLNIDAFHLVGTSSGGVVAFRYAAVNTDRVQKLVLINSAGLPRTPETDPLGTPGSEHRAEIEQINKPRSYWQGLYDNNFKGSHTPPAWLVDMAYDMSRREGLGEELQRYTRAYRTGDPKTLLSQIEAPTLIVWGLNNPTVVHLEADVFQHWLTSAYSLVRKIPGTGHYPYIEEPDVFDDLLTDFFTGTLDGELRRTVMTPMAAD